MTQESAEPKNIRNFEKFESTRFPTYQQAQVFATLKFDELSGEKKERDFSGPNHRVRIRRRSNQGRECFDVVSYRKIGAQAAPIPEPTPPVTEEVLEKKPRVKAKDRRAREQKTA